MNNIRAIKTYLSNNKVCFVTNSLCLPSSLLISSLKTYIEYIPIQNFWVINGIKNNEPFYGIQTFIEMLNYMLSTDHFDYVIYLDDDCFINDMDALIEEFKRFKSSNCCIAGAQDGGVFCHRNHSKRLINTFLSFWNISLLRSKNITFNNILDYITKNIKQNDFFNVFFNNLKTNNEKLFNFIESQSNLMVSNIKEYREKTCSLPNHETPYCKIVKNDPTNKIEQYQTPYTYDDNKAISNFEPYYIVEQALIELSGTPIYYLFGTDLYHDNYVKNNEQFDLSGLTSSILTITDEHRLIAVHTWYSRAYTKWPTVKMQLDQTKRINTIIKKYSRI